MQQRKIAALEVLKPDSPTKVTNGDFATPVQSNDEDGRSSEAID